MELPQPSRPFRAEGRKPTLDFLSLCSPVQQDPRPPQGGYLKTHDFLQPLNQVGKIDDNHVDVRIVEKPPPPPAPPPPPPPPPHAVSRTLPGGIGSYSISFYDRTLLNPEGTSLLTIPPPSSGGGGGDRYEENSNNSSYTSAMNKNMGKTGKENSVGEAVHWTTSLEQLTQKNQSFINMITSSGIDQDEDDEEDEDFVVKKEPSSSSHLHPQSNLSTDQKPNTPRSKHSATEQRRRSKINDRFQKLREIIPHSDQKRDKASFLLEVIEYIQYLQEKEIKYERSCPGWNHEQSKFMPLVNPIYRSGDQSQCTNSSSGQPLIYANNSMIGLPQTIPLNGHKKVDLNMNNIGASKYQLQNKAVSYTPQLQQQILPISGGRSNMDIINKTESNLQTSFLQSKSCTTIDSVAPSDHEQTIESGTISISSVYSQGLLSSLTQALQNTGVDLSQANVSVQIDLGKKAKSNEAIKRSSGEESDQPFKRIKASRGY